MEHRLAQRDESSRIRILDHIGASADESSGKAEERHV